MEFKLVENPCRFAARLDDTRQADVLSGILGDLADELGIALVRVARLDGVPGAVVFGEGRTERAAQDVGRFVEGFLWGVAYALKTDDDL